MSLFIKNAKIATMDKSLPLAAAAVVIGEHFAYVGSEEGAETFISSHPEITFETVDCGGHLVTPGLNDSHMHYLHYIRKTRLGVDLFDADSLAEVLRRLEKAFEQYDKKSGLWLVGEGWNQDYFTDEKRFPTSRDLDKITSDYPIIVMRACFHIGVLNTKAMEIIGLNADKAKELGDIAETYSDGSPNGVIKEAFFDKIKSIVPTPDIEDLVAMMIDGQKECFSKGLTSVQSDDLLYAPEGKGFELMRLLRDAAQEKKLRLRIGEQAVVANIEELRHMLENGFDKSFGNETFNVSCIKILSDGSLGARSAYMRYPYNDAPDTKGIPIFSQQELDDMVMYCQRCNMPVAIHAIGDAAIEECLNSIEKAQISYPYFKPRHGIVHCQITDSSMPVRFADLNICAFVQPIFISYDMGIVYDRLGKDLAETSYVWKTFKDLGVHMSFGTDCPVEEFDTMPNIYSAVTRKNQAGNKVFLEDQAMTVEDSLYAYTVEGAYCSGEDNIKGMVRPGMLADFIVLDKDLYSIDPMEIKDVKILSTYVGGENVYDA